MRRIGTAALVADSGAEGGHVEAAVSCRVREAHDDYDSGVGHRVSAFRQVHPVAIRAAVCLCGHEAIGVDRIYAWRRLWVVLERGGHWVLLLVRGSVRN